MEEKNPLREYNIDGFLMAILIFVAAIYFESKGIKTSMYYTLGLVILFLCSRSIIKFIFWAVRGLGELGGFIKYSIGKFINGE